MDPYRPRLADHVIAELLAGFPALFLTGPRSVGKTTTARRFARSVVQLDRSLEADVVRADPDAVLRDLPEPVLIDEWQLAPDVLGAVKRAVDRDPRPGRYIVAGSARARREPQTWPGTGRLIEVPMYGLTVRELLGRVTGPSFADRAIANDLTTPHDAPDLRGYVDLALRSGFPQAALRNDASERRRWLRSYLDLAVSRDAEEIARRDPLRLRRYLDALALNSAGVPQDRTLHEAAGIAKDTGSAYDRLLADLMLVESVPAWWTNRLKRLTTTPKRYVVDPGLMASSIGADAQTVMKDGDVLGRLLDTFVAAQIRPELALHPDRPRLHHLRTRDGREVDLLVEFGGGRLLAIEVKAAGAVSSRDARHLAWLRDQLGDRFLAGVVLHTGPRAHQISERIVAAPIATMWSHS